ncbi:MAG: phosphomannomutase/phosphoglucomutase [Phycisphaerae bacterium]
MVEQNPNEYGRTCPGQNYTISDAVCMARQMRHHRVCQECRFQDLTAKPSNKKDETPISRGLVMDKIFKAYDIRGTYPDQLNEDIAWRIGHAAANFFRSQLTGYARSDPKQNVLAVGRDMRKSSPTLCKAFIDGVLSAGVNCIDVGMIDTSQIYFAVNFLKTAGAIQTTASHNPGHYNGFKITGAGGKPIGQDTGLQEIKRIAQAVPPRSSIPQAELTTRDVTSEYKTFIRGFIKEPVKKLKIVVDASNGMGGKYWPIIFGDIKELQVTALNFEHNGDFVHDPNPLVESNLKQLCNEVKRQKADFGICLDGDSDRCVLVDEKGTPVASDLLTALLAGYFIKQNPGTTVVYDLRSSWVLKEEILKAGGVPRRERVGHSFMKKAMSDTKAAFGGELSGHFYFRDNWYCDSAFIAIATILDIVTETNKSISRLIAPLKRFFASGERNFQAEDKDERIKSLAEKYKDGKIDYLDGITIEYADWWCNVRKSNTEPLLRLNLEAKTKSLLESKMSEIAPLLGTPSNH